MKIGIIGTGAVGAACALATLMRGIASEIVLVNRSRDRSRGMATDMGYGAPLSSVTKIRDGEYSDLADAALIMITAGVNEKTGGATDRRIRWGDYVFSIRTPQFTVMWSQGSLR
jgi:L-lactate dehydrogenase